MRVISVSCVFVLLHLAAGLEEDGPFKEGCLPCDQMSCPKQSNDCTAGTAEDLCGCCEHGVCGRGIDDKCFSPELEYILPITDKKYGLCGENMDCVLKYNAETNEPPEGRCVCNDQRVVCGANNRTYDNICQVQQEATQHIPVTVQGWGPCLSAPMIVSPPMNTLVDLNQPMSLDCEVKGFPVPRLRWEFIPLGDVKDGSVKTLPGDDQNVAVQTRGGPAPLMITSWLQIVKIRASDVGLYICIAENSGGVSQATAKISLYQRYFNKYHLHLTY